MKYKYFQLRFKEKDFELYEKLKELANKQDLSIHQLVIKLLKTGIENI